MKARQRQIGRPKRQTPQTPAAPTVRRYDVMLEIKTAEWAKQQPRGLSGLLRDLLREAYDRARK